MSKIWSKEETLWSFALYGTAVGAGTLFLPIQLGSAGAIVLFITALVAWPLTYWPHKALWIVTVLLVLIAPFFLYVFAPL
ncbi:hypothetical protein ACQKEG_16645, partial [Klebsiella quasipneumoniae]